MQGKFRLCARFRVVLLVCLVRFEDFAHFRVVLPVCLVRCVDASKQNNISKSAQNSA